MRQLRVREADLCDIGEAARIDGFVRDQEGSTPFHLTGWSRAVATGCRQRARYLVAEHGDGVIAGVLPLTDVRSPLFGRALVSTGFGVGGGVLGDAVVPLADAAWDLAERLGIASVELRGGETPAGWVPDASSYCGFVRPLAADDAAEMLAIPRKQRAEVRRAATLGLAVRTGHEFDGHYAVYAESVRNLGTPVFPKALFGAVLAELDADILMVEHGGAAVASVLSLYHGGCVYPYWGGGTERSRALRAHEHMYFALMRHARARGCTRFDFGRSKTGTGAAAFKKNFGFDAQPLTYCRRSAGSPREVNPLNPKYAAMIAGWKRLPLWLANRAGPIVARGLG